MPWKPKKMFSFRRIKAMYSFSWKLLTSELINQGYDELRSLFIGKRFTLADLAYYDQGMQLPKLVVGNINSSFTKVLFPTFSELQDEKGKLKYMLRGSIQASSYLLFPVLIGLVLVANDLVPVLFSNNWVEMIPYLQVLCLAFLFQPMSTASSQAYKALGRADIVLRLTIIKKVVGVIILLLSIFLFESPFIIAVGFVIECFLNWALNIGTTARLLNYTLFEQLKDILPTSHQQRISIHSRPAIFTSGVKVIDDGSLLRRMYECFAPLLDIVASLLSIADITEKARISSGSEASIGVVKAKI